MDITGLFVSPGLYVSADSKSHETPYSYSESYHNNSNVDVYVMTINNVPVLIRGKPLSMGNLRGDWFVIRTTYTLRGTDTISTVKKDIEKRIQIAQEHGHLNNGKKGLYGDLLLMNEAISRCLANNPQTHKVEIHIDRDYSVSKLVSLKKILCLDSNILIFTGLPQEQQVHPESNLAKHSIIPKAIEENPGSLSINLVLIDKEHSLKKRFVTFGKSVYEVPVRHDENLEDGLHVCVAQGDAPTQQQIVPLDKLEEAGLYSSQEEAISNFSHDDNVRLIEEQRKVAELKLRAEQFRLEAEALRSENEIARITTDRKIQEATLEHKKKIAMLEEQQRQALVEQQKNENASKLKHQEELNKLKEEKDRITNLHLESKLKTENIFKAISADRENFYDQRSHERKDTSEIIKYGLPIFAGIVGGFMIRDKFN